jgi:sialic acid synthase SpsE
MSDVFVIAELGVNWRNLAECDLMISEAAKCGVNAVKVQAYSYADIKGHEREEELNKILLKETDIRYLYYRACQHGVELIVTPMYPECVTWINPYVKRWKVRYSDRFNMDLLSKIYETGKEVLISCDEPPTSQDAWEKRDRHAKYLYCISEYPPKKGHDLINNYKGFDGASCHYPTIEDALDFVRLGADYLEVHVMRDQYDLNGEYEPIDCKVSLRMSELKELVTRIRSGDY